MINKQILVETALIRFNSNLPFKKLSFDEIHFVLSSMLDHEESHEMAKSFLAPGMENACVHLMIPELDTSNRFTHPTLLSLEIVKGEMAGVEYRLEYIDLVSFIEIFLFADHCSSYFFTIKNAPIEFRMRILMLSTGNFYQQFKRYLKFFHPNLFTELDEQVQELIYHMANDDFMNDLQQRAKKHKK